MNAHIVSVTSLETSSLSRGSASLTLIPLTVSFPIWASPSAGTSPGGR